MDEIDAAIKKAEAHLDVVKAAAVVVREANALAGLRMCNAQEAYICPDLKCARTDICHRNLTIRERDAA